MPWTVFFEQDQGKGVGVGHAVFTDEQSGDVVLDFRSRLDTNNQQSIDRFVSEAQTALQSQQARRTDESAAIAKIESALNAER